MQKRALSNPIPQHIENQRKIVRFDRMKKQLTLQKGKNGREAYVGEVMEEGESNNQLIKSKIKQDGENSMKLNTREFGNKVKSYKIEKIVKEFTNKLRRNTIYREPTQYDPFADFSVGSYSGFYMKQPFLSIYLIISIISSALFCIWATLTIIFDQITTSNTCLIGSNAYGILWMACQIIFGFTRINISDGLIRKTLKQISMNYLKSGFIIDFLCFISFLINLVDNSGLSDYIKIAFLFRIPDCCAKVYKLEIKWVDSFYFEKYWILTKILVKNFFFAHLIALVLILMAYLETDNWLADSNLTHVQWFEQYSWAYYWATNIMLTVGFGDFHAANYKQAICLIFIQTISCLTLAYNISCIGALLNQLRGEELEKAKNFKLVKNITQKNYLGIEMSESLNKFVEESHNTKQQDQFQQENSLITKLPQNLLKQFKKQANMKLIRNISFIANFSQKIISQIAHQLEPKMMKPGQIIFSQVGDNPKLKLLKSGEIGFYANFPNSRYKNIAFDSITIGQDKDMKIISYEFLDRRKFSNFVLKSKGYSVIHELSYDSFVEIIKTKQADFQYFFKERDKYSNRFSPIACEFCPENHSKINCPKIHYAPLKQVIILKFISKVKSATTPRRIFTRKKAPLINVFVNFNSTTNFEGVTSLSELFPTNSDAYTTSRRSWMISKELQKKFLQKQEMQVPTNRFYLFQAETSQFSFWQCEADSAKNYKYYFPQKNPDLLSEIIKPCKKATSTKKFIQSGMPISWKWASR